MRRKGRNYARLVKVGILLAYVSFCLVSCTAFNPSVFVSYQVLNPNAEVRANPLGFLVFDSEALHYVVSWDADFNPDSTASYFIVNSAFVAHYKELWDEVDKLQKQKGD